MLAPKGAICPCLAKTVLHALVPYHTRDGSIYTEQYRFSYEGRLFMLKATVAISTMVRRKKNGHGQAYICNITGVNLDRLSRLQYCVLSL